MRKLLDLYYDFYYRRYVPYRLPTGHERIYFYHIRKTGGTSFSSMLLASFARGRKPPDALWEELWAARRHRMLVGDKVFVAGERRLLERGDYFYGTSHIPMHEITIPAKTYTITCLRDPLDRVISHYRMLLTQQKNNSPAFSKEGGWLGGGFKDFLRLIPREHLLRQVYTFSAKYDAAEAFDKIQKIDNWFFTKDINNTVKAFAHQLGGEAPEPVLANSSEVRFVPTADERSMAEDLLSVEIELYANLLKARSASSR